MSAQVGDWFVMTKNGRAQHVAAAIVKGHVAFACGRVRELSYLTRSKGVQRCDTCITAIAAATAAVPA